MVLEQVAFDIETTGFNVGDAVTVVGFAVPMGVRVFVNTDGRAADGIDDAVTAATDTAVAVSTHDTERDVLVAVREFATERLCDEDVLVVAFNGERWRGGFDLPFLRTRYATLGVPWPFVDVPYADLLPVVEKRFNTTVDSDESNDLESAYEVLCTGDAGAVDPFDDSAEAVTAFDDGRFADLVLHNVADVKQTRALGGVAERYCSKAEFDVKSLTPTRPI